MKINPQYPLIEVPCLPATWIVFPLNVLPFRYAIPSLHPVSPNNHQNTHDRAAGSADIQQTRLVREYNLVVETNYVNSEGKAPNLKIMRGCKTYGMKVEKPNKSGGKGKKKKEEEKKKKKRKKERKSLHAG